MVPVIQSQPDQNVHERKELRHANMEFNAQYTVDMAGRKKAPHSRW